MSIPFDLSQVDWIYVGLLALFALAANFVANLLSFRHRGYSAVLAAILFSAIFVFWTYYPHGLQFLPTSIAAPTAVAPAGNSPAATRPTTTPQRPSNPVTDLTPQGSQ